MCKKRAYYANVNYKSKYSADVANAENIEDNKSIAELCGCIKFSEFSKAGNCLIMQNENRILTFSLKYSAPVYYSYSCTVNEIHFTEKECIEKALKLAASVIPDGISGCAMPEMLDSISENFIETVKLYFPGKDNRIITVGIRRDTCHAVYFDARQIFGSL